MSTLFEYPVAGPDAYEADPCVPEDTTTPILVTENGVEYVRTPDDAFVNLKAEGYPWEPNYAMIEGMRVHYIDVGPKDDNTEVMLLLHGQPSWSFLYRKMIPVLEERGYRVIAMDWLGMGRSDKPVDLAEHTYKKHVARLKEFIQKVIPEALETPTINLFVQDWGSLLGLRVAGDEPQWFRRIISANGMLPVMPGGGNPMVVHNPVNYNCSDTRNARQMSMDRIMTRPCGNDASCFSIWANYALTSPALTASELLQVATTLKMEESELALYDAPFPDFVYKAAIRTFPSMIAGVHEPEFGNIKAWASLQNFSRPYLALAGEDDKSLGSPQTQNMLTSNIAGASIHDFEHKRYQGAAHFIQEDAGMEMAAYVADFVDGTASLIDGTSVEDGLSAGEDDISGSSSTNDFSAAKIGYGQGPSSNGAVLLLVFVAWFLHLK